MSTVIQEAPGAPPTPRQRSRRALSRPSTPFLLLAPGVGLVLIVMVWPVLYGIWMSVTKTNTFTGVTSFAGLEQYLELFADPVFRNALTQSCILVAGTVVGGVIASMGTALTLHHAPWAGRVWRTIVLVPGSSPGSRWPPSGARCSHPPAASPTP